MVGRASAPPAFAELRDCSDQSQSYSPFDFIMSSSPEHYEYLLPPTWKTQVTAWLQEDTPSFDFGGFVVGEAHREAFLLGKGHQTAVLAGKPFFTEVFTQLGCE